eukprot:CAMPEP_0197175318 /NCGR_PEP_ID=MMETSP1423-20130617/1569_1 /TAXON_ID=476441 /ORGANISM="Pseudo-nitzschia heimii, Strain UNC1101" /LENGTH=535 /DNA_ID=CAMNT_0042624441 /DNA_START=105 /DNA_END=1712 /DNA_ORIENTATION=-
MIGVRNATTATTAATTTTTIMASRGRIATSCVLVATALALIAVPIDAFSCPPRSVSVPTVRPPVATSMGCDGIPMRSALFASSESEDEAGKKDDENTEATGANGENEKDDNDDDDETGEAPETAKKGDQEAAAERWQAQARELREQIEKMEADLPERELDPERVSALEAAQKAAAEAVASAEAAKEPVSLLDGKNVLLVGSNGRLGSMVCRRLLRQHPEIANVVAMVHVVGENSETSRGYGRLAYEVGAEDGRGSIGPAWSADDRTATFEFDEEVMTPYNLQKLRVVECELLDPVQCKTIVDDAKADVVVWCATDFNGSTPRALSGGSGPLSGLPFLFRAVADPDKGRVEVEGLQNMLGALKTYKQESIQRNRQLTAFGGVEEDRGRSRSVPKADTEKEKDDETRGVDFLLVSSCPDALGDFETPFGSFWDIKRQGEDMIPDQFPSFKYSVLQFATFEDNFVKEDLDFKLMEVVDEPPRVPRNEEDEQRMEELRNKKQRKVRRINRRDAARAVGDALVDPEFHNKKIQVWTNEVG